MTAYYKPVPIIPDHDRRYGIPAECNVCQEWGVGEWERGLTHHKLVEMDEDEVTVRLLQGGNPYWPGV